MGPVDDLRALYEWAHVLWMAYDTWGGDQDYFSNIYRRRVITAEAAWQQRVGVRVRRAL